jgi:hypothetical protein
MNNKQAKDFLADQAAQQAALDRTLLSDLERRMMYFTESDPASCDDPVSLHDEFEAKYDTAEYEAKMSRLLSRAYRRLKTDNPGGKLQWDDAVSTLKKGDHYVLLLLRQTPPANNRTGDPGSKVIKYGTIFLIGLPIVGTLASDPRVPTWVSTCLGASLLAPLALTMFFLVQQGYRALRGRGSN